MVTTDVAQHPIGRFAIRYAATARHATIKQYHKEGIALRTETTINDPGDFIINRGLTNLPAMRKVGFQANRRLLHVEHISHDPATGTDAFTAVTEPTNTSGQHAAGLRFGDPEPKHCSRCC